VKNLGDTGTEPTPAVEKVPYEIVMFLCLHSYMWMWRTVTNNLSCVQ